MSRHCRFAFTQAGTDRPASPEPLSTSLKKHNISTLNKCFVVRNFVCSICMEAKKGRSCIQLETCGDVFVPSPPYSPLHFFCLTRFPKSINQILHELSLVVFHRPYPRRPGPLRPLSLDQMRQGENDLGEGESPEFKFDGGRASAGKGAGEGRTGVDWGRRVAEYCGRGVRGEVSEIEGEAEHRIWLVDDIHFCFRWSCIDLGFDCRSLHLFLPS